MHISKFFINAHFIRSELFSKTIRKRIYRLAGIKIGKSSIVLAPDFIGSKRISIGDNSFINRQLFALLHPDFEESQIIIGNNVSVGPNVKLYTITHRLEEKNCRAGEFYTKKIIIEDGVWIGGNTPILPGVRIGKGSVVAAGSVVVKDIESDSIYAGNPAIKKRSLNSLEGAYYNE